MRSLALAALAASCVLAKTRAKVNHSANPIKVLARSPVGAVAARQDASGEFCGTDDDGINWYCDDPSTACCTGNEIWQCAPLAAEECCSTGYYCNAGTHCYLDKSGEQLCLTPEEAGHTGDVPSEDDTTGGGSRGGHEDDDDDEGDSGSGGRESTPTRKADEAEETTGRSDLGDDGNEDDRGTSEASEEEDKDGGSTVAVGGRRKGRKGSKSGAGRLGVEGMVAGAAALGLLALV